MNLCTETLLVKFRMHLIGNNVFGPGTKAKIVKRYFGGGGGGGGGAKIDIQYEI